MNRKFRVAIIGAGISGLSAAYFLKKKSVDEGLDVDLNIVERSSRPGGVIRTEVVQDFLLEWGPDSFVAYRPQTRKFIKELGLEDELIGSKDELRRTFILRNSQLESLPRNMGFFIPVRLSSLWSNPSISTSGKLRALLEPFVRPSRGDLSVQEFLVRRLGKELTENIAGPLVAAIHGGNIQQLSAVSVLPELHRMEQKYGSLWQGIRAFDKHRPTSSRSLFLTMRHGMSQLIEGLVKELSHVSLHCSVEDTRLLERAGTYQVKGNQFDQNFDLVVLSAPATSVANVLSAMNREAADILSQIPYSSTTLVYLAYSRREFSHPLDGFGFIVPKKERTRIDACSWVSSKFSGRCPKDQVLLRCTLRQAPGEARQPESREHIIDATHQEIQRTLNISCRPTFASSVHIEQATPQLNVGHQLRIGQVDLALKRHPGVLLCGAFFGSGIPQCIETARLTALRAVEVLKSL